MTEYTTLLSGAAPLPCLKYCLSMRVSMMRNGILAGLLMVEIEMMFRS